MKKATDIHRQLLRARREVARIKRGLASLISKLPPPTPATGIKQVAPNVTVVSLSQIAGVKTRAQMFGGKKVGVRTGSDWAAETYNFQLQYDALVDLVNKTEPEKVIRVLCEVLENAHIQYRTHKISLHPEVVQNVLNLLDSTTAM